MITVKEAQKIVLDQIPPDKEETLAIEASVGRRLARDVKARIDLPVADNSAMDGYVIRARDAVKMRAGARCLLTIAGTIKAGDRSGGALRAGQAFRIMTGAFLPTGGDAIVPKEKAVLQQGKLYVKKPVMRFAHVRFRGEEIKKGARIMCAGRIISPAAVGVLAMQGYDKVVVHAKPAVSVVATGSELLQPGRRLRPGAIYDSNSFMLRACLGQMGFNPVHIATVADQKTALRKSIRHALVKSDILILVGGVSVGDYDYVKPLLAEFGVRTLFWCVRQKPGKPIYFGRKGRKLIFGLPGNPASAFLCFYEYVYPALRAWEGFSGQRLKRLRAKLTTAIRPDERRDLFLKATLYRNGKGFYATPLSHQGSHMISSLVNADGFIRVPAGNKHIRKNAAVWFDIVPGGGAA